MKKYFFHFLFFLFSLCVFSENSVRVQKLSSESSSWTSVMGGKALCIPKMTSYGFAVLTDGKMISAFTEKGVKLWEKQVPGKPEPYLTVFSDDFLLSVNDGKNLSLINPSGLTLWTKKVPFKIENEPVTGRDSRIFVRGKNKIACYGINGICKWILNTQELREENLFEMNDGSIFVFLKALKDGKSTGIRFSPFGEILEEISFKGIVKSALSHEDGLLLTFSEGGAGMCSVLNGKTETKWTIPYSDRAFSNTNVLNGAKFINLSSHRASLLVSGTGNIKTRIMVFSTIDGRVSDWFNSECLFNEVELFLKTNGDENIFISDKKKASIFDTTGNILWSGLLPEKPDLFSTWNFMTFTKENYLVLCTSSWAMAGFRTTYKIQKRSKKNQYKKDYNVFYAKNVVNTDSIELFEKIPEYFTGNNRTQLLKNGLYGKNESDFISALLALCKDYNQKLIQKKSSGSAGEKSIYEKDISSMQEILGQLELFGLDTFSPYIASFIKLTKDDFILQTLLKNISTFGYDPSSLILNSIDEKLHFISSSKTKELILICDAVLEICRFMGRPALYSHGIEILTQLLYPQYESSVRDYARNTLTKIARLKI